ncbi:MAG TPA: hypothetical protein ENF33_01695 [Nitrososphaeria archaeon]|nr:hypothetical protein [Nitrososphaeria archaeon]
MKDIFSGQKVTTKEIKEFTEALSLYGCNSMTFITTSTFTDRA